MLEQLKRLIDEANYPYFSDAELQMRIDEAAAELEEGETLDLYPLARELCLVKAGIEEIKLGDVTIPSPRRHFVGLAAKYRRNCGGMVVRADGQ